MATTVHVKNISTQTTEKEVRDFFSFCGKISNLSVEKEGSAQTATVTFEKPTAAKTALLLDNTQLGPSLVQVSGNSSQESSGGAATDSSNTKDSSHEVDQEDKPRSRILAEYLAQGYVISDKAIERAIALDNQHGISSRFTNALSQFDQRYKATEKVQGIDAKLGVSDYAAAGWRSMNSYFDKALGTPSGQKLRSFYETQNRQVLDVHNEARHLADMKSGKAPLEHIPGSDKTKCSCGGDTTRCSCSTSTCTCSSCPKNQELKEKMQIHSVGDSGKTACSCGGDKTKCPCEPGKCACSSCPKAGIEKQEVPGTDKTKCNCGADSGKCPCAPGKCACANCPKN